MDTALIWTWRIKHHLDRAENELGKLQDDFEDVLRQSKDARERNYDQERIVDLYEQLA